MKRAFRLPTLEEKERAWFDSSPCRNCANALRQDRPQGRSCHHCPKHAEWVRKQPTDTDPKAG